MALSVGLRLMSSIINTGSVKEFSKLEIRKEHLKPAELECYEFIQKFIYKHKSVPKKTTVLDEIDVSLPLAKETPSYYANQVQERFISDQIKVGFEQIKKTLEKDNLDIAASVQTLTDTLMTVSQARNIHHMVDFKEAEAYMAKAYKEKKIQGMDGSVLIGYPSVDVSAGGMQGGDVVSIVGRPAMGKTFHTLNIARNAWYKQKKTVLYVTMEMNILSIYERLTSMHTKHNLTQLKKAQLTTKAYNSMLHQLSLNKDEEQSFWVVDGNLTATVEDIWKLCMQVNPDFVVVDGAYLLKHPNFRMGKFERVAENAELLKSLVASDINVPCLCSWQFNRDATKKMEKNKDAKAGLEDIGSTDVIGQISSIVLGLTQSESVETLITRKVEILKGRNGETGSFMTNWDFVNMDFSEIVDNPWVEGQYEQMQELIV